MYGEWEITFIDCGRLKRVRAKTDAYAILTSPYSFHPNMNSSTIVKLELLTTD
jgi:hypothetical protein